MDSAVPTMADLETRILQITCKQLDLHLEKVSLDSRLVQDLGFDSLELVEYIIALEQEFNVSIPDELTQLTFTDAEFTIRSAAHMVFLCWGTGSVSRSIWTDIRSPLPQSEETPFTQHGGRLSGRD